MRFALFTVSVIFCRKLMVTKKQYFYLIGRKFTDVTLTDLSSLVHSDSEFIILVAKRENSKCCQWIRAKQYKTIKYKATKCNAMQC